MRAALAAVDVLVALTCVVLAVAAVRRRAEAPGAGPLAALLLGLAAWGLGGAYVTAADAAAPGVFLARHLAEGATLVVAVALWFVVASVVDPTRRPSRAVRTLVLIPAGTALVLLATDPWHHRYFELAGDGVAPGPAYWVGTAACYLTAGLAVAGGLLALPSAGPFRRRQLRVVLLGVVPTVVSSTAGLVWALSDSDGGQLARLGFGPTAVIVTVAVFRHEMVRVATVAREQVFEHLAQAVVVTDHTGRLVDLNPEGRTLVARIAPGARGDLTLTDLGLTLPDPEDLEDVLLREVPVAQDAWIDVRARALRDPHGRHVGWVLLVSDATDEVRRVRQLRASTLELLTRTTDLSIANQRLNAELVSAEQVRAQLSDDLQHDELTGLHNRRALEPSVDAALDAARASHGHASLVALDVDHFKDVNDAYGHAVGDTVLRAVAAGLAAHARPTDTVVRVGGEEFVLVMPGIDHAAALRRAHELRVHAGAAPGAVGAPRVTLSAGVASFPQDGTTPADVLEAADRALYAAKRRGRDRVESATTTGPDPQVRPA
ncbi:MAG: diguanylate cyclase [Cellulomonas iranensis]|uniref:diguanylate cyclase n=1 Tax=Cellulomonas iranensis TaxID=76862 RepID=UPI001B04876B|nr:diguanylate cyclase [Cellulomonas iranensis]MBO9568917.1 diguanylate cyclase [Cellulomonas iranensis]